MWDSSERKGDLLGFHLHGIGMGGAVRQYLDRLRRILVRAPHHWTGRVSGQCLLVRGDRRRDSSFGEILRRLDRLPSRLRSPP